MASRYLRILLLAEIAAYCALGYWIRVTLGWSYAAIAGSAVAISIGIRLLVVLGGTVISNIARSPRAPEHQVGLAGGVAVFLRSCYAVISTNYWLFPFDALALRPDPKPAPGNGMPVLFVHGYFSNRGYFNRLVPLLEARGVSPVFAPSFPSAFCTIESLAQSIHEHIERLCTASGHDQVILVCHSMGGLAARTYLCEHGRGRVRKLITIGTPHHGTLVAWFGTGANAVQMRHGSEFLRSLEVREAGAGPACETTSIYTPHDNLVVPQASSILPRARNVVIPGRGHVDVLDSAHFLEVLLEELRAAGVSIR
jgi:pimeloyl-ACP methyl ester carboxylesterase